MYEISKEHTNKKELRKIIAVSDQRIRKIKTKINLKYI